ncbi:MAG: hypothetical protein LBH87_01370 [Coriobacteriales bacterium]|jgi:ArsR family metal-binding transcriptional regulator|nr:hypothetical protein [Coriobacteriales bacterium]
MLIESIRVIETSPCHAEKDKFKAITEASADLTEILPYLNSVVDKPNYQPNAKSLVFKSGINGFTLMGNQINVTKFVNTTELHELLDWVKNLINDVYEGRADIEPNYESRKIVPVLTIYSMLPKTNCGKCSEVTCMAFAAKLNKVEVELDDCPTLLEPEYQELLGKLTAAMS